MPRCRRWPPRPDARRRRRGRQSRAGRQRPRRTPPHRQGRRRWNRGKRRNSLCARSAPIRKEERRGHDRHHVKPANADNTSGENQHCHANRPGGNHGLDANEGGHGAEVGPQHAHYSHDDSSRPRLQQLDDRGGVDESEVKDSRVADPDGGFRKGRGRIDTRPASIRTQSRRSPHNVKDRSKRTTGPAAVARYPGTCPQRN